MKKAILIILSILVFIPEIMAQTVPNGMNYQAVARDITGEVMANQEVFLKIHLQSEENLSQKYYTETHNPTTNQFGLFSIVIGEGTVEKGAFSEIPWSTEDIWIEIAISENGNSNYKTISNSKLLAVPYAFHANTASKIEGEIVGERGPGAGNVWKLVGNTNTDPSIDKLGTGDETDLNIVTNDSIRIQVTSDGDVNIANSLNVGEDLIVQGVTDLNGQVTISADLPEGEQDNYDDYPLRVEGGKQGVAIRLESEDNSYPRRDQNFITFFESQGTAIGRIEGNSLSRELQKTILRAYLCWNNCAHHPPQDCSSVVCFDLEGEPDQLCFDVFEDLQTMKSYFTNGGGRDLVFDGINLTMSSIKVIIKWVVIWPSKGSSIPFTDLVDAIFDTIGVGIGITQYVFKIVGNVSDRGVAFESGGADFAEWLEKAYKDEIISNGQVVGVKGGKISKTFTDADQYMAITSNPIIIGGMPDKENESGFEKVALLGQVPILVYGYTNMGDYILPSGNGDGSAIAVAPDLMKANDFSKIIGVAWSKSDSNNRYNYINTAVGFNTNQLGMVVNNLQTVVNAMQEELVKLNPDFKPVYFDTQDARVNYSLDEFLENEELVGEACECQDASAGFDRFYCRIKCYLSTNDVSGIGPVNIITELVRKNYPGEIFFGEEASVILRILKDLMNTGFIPQFEPLVEGIFDVENGGFLDIDGENIDCFPWLRNILENIRDHKLTITHTGDQIDVLKAQATQLKKGLAFLQFLISD